MKITRKTRLFLGAQNIATVVLYVVGLGLLGWLSTQYTLQFDWTAGNRNTLTEASQGLLETIEGPVRITAFARESELLRERIRDLVARYRRYKSDVSLTFVNPDTDPERVRRLGIRVDGELYIEYRGRSEQLQELGEQDLSNALQRLASAEPRLLSFLSGHGERAPRGEANHDLNTFSRELERKGFAIQKFNLSETPSIPDDTSVLVIARPQVDLLPGELRLIAEYMDRGGNLLWLGDPGDRHGLDGLAADLGIRFLPGTIVDATTQLMGIDNPSFALIADFPMHPITKDFAIITLYPQAAALEVDESSKWEVTKFLNTLDRAWTETGPIEGDIRFDQESEERPGPLTIGVAMERSIPEAEPVEDEVASLEKRQRVVVTGDGDFISNAFLGNGGNFDLGARIVHWLSHDDRLIQIPPRVTLDRSLQLSETATLVISFGFLFGFPVVLLASGFGVWHVRRRR